MIVKAGTTPAVGDTTILCTVAAATGACDLEIGDVVTIHGYDYALQAAATQASAAGEVTLSLDRGLESAAAASGAVTLATGTSLVTLAGDFRGLGLVTRIPADNVLGFSTQGNQFPIYDERSGVVMALTVFEQYAQIAFEVSLVWGSNAIDSRRLCRVETYAS